MTILRKCIAAAAVLSSLIASAAPSFADDQIFDELRFGSAIAVDKSRTNDERGSFHSLTVFFDPFDLEHAADWKEKLLRPRIHVGAALSTSDEANMAYAGFTWTANVTKKAFLEFGFGGTVHDGDLDYDGSPGPKLGCHTLFRESIAAGYDITEHWRVLAQLEHSSHANLCGKTNNGLTRAGILVGYKF